MKKQLLMFAGFLVCAAAVTRVLRHFGFIDLPPNVAPVAALAMFSGAYLPKRLAVVLPLATMLLSDLVIGWYSPAVMASVYLGFFISVLIGFWLRRSPSVGRIVSGSLTGSVTFFLVTNAAVWLYGGLYPGTLQGLGASYLAGIPFFRNTVIGDLAFTGIMFGAYEAAQYLVRRRAVALDTH